MASILFLILSVAVLATATASGVFLTQEHAELLSCVQHLLTRQLPPGHSLVVSLPIDDTITNHRTLAPQNDHASYFTTVDTLLQTTHKTATWPVFVPRPRSQSYDNFLPYKHHMYVIFVWPERGKDINGTLAYQMENLVENFESFNRRGMFVIVTLGYEELSPRYYAKIVIDILWRGNKITNAFVIIPNKQRYTAKSAAVNVSKGSIQEFLVYTWSAYESNQCDRVQEVFLIDKWVMGRFESNAAEFRSKPLRNLNGCRVRVSAVHFPPSVIMTQNTTATGEPQYRGVEMEYLFLLSQAMNMSVVFRPPTEGEILHQLTTAFSEATVENLSDMAIGFLLLNPVITSFGDPSIPYMFTNIEWSVPCPNPARRVEQLKSMFAPSVWLLIILVFILMSVVFWCMARIPRQPITIDSNACMSLLNCLQLAWAILLSVSVPKIPQRNSLRTAFVTYVWYCFAVATVFQSYFTSYLAQPGHGTQIRTLQQLNESDLTIYIPYIVQKMIFFTSYEAYSKLKLPTEISANHSDSFTRLTQDKDVAMVALSLLSEYFVAKEGKFGKYKEYVCTLDEAIGTTGISMYFAKGNPLLNSIDVLIRRCFEAGLVDKYTSELMWKTRLENSRKSLEHETEGSDHMYFTFTLLHVRLAFQILVAGYTLSSFVCLAEFMYAVKRP
jgi:hypothetical protein